MSSTAFSAISVITGLGIAALSFFLAQASPLNYAMLVLAMPPTDETFDARYGRR